MIPNDSTGFLFSWPWLTLCNIVSTEMVSHLLQSFAFAAGVTLHIDSIRGENNHHM